jgi:hypothetical protein
MKNCAFTICAKNYIGLALILEKSFKQHNKNCAFYIFVADEFETHTLPSDLPSNIIFSREVLNLSDAEWINMSFKYNLTEFCTAIKPFCFQYFFDLTQYENIIYLDPDIYFFNSIDCIFNLLSTYSIILTPHILSIEMAENDNKIIDELLHTGIFNLGFIAVKKDNNSKKMFHWWENKLKEKCFIDIFDFQFTDQKWMNFLPIFFGPDEICINRHKGLNVAPWNFYEREIISENNIFRVKFREYDTDDSDELIFVHYSGFDYNALKENKFIHKRISSWQEFEDINLIIDIYAQVIIKERYTFDSYIRFPYTYNYFDNGVSIDKFHRRIYRSLIVKKETFFNPFSTEKKSYYDILKRKKLLIIETKIETSVENVSIKSINALGRKLKILNFISRVILRIIGYKNYVLFLRSLPLFSRYESHIHLLEKKYDSDNLFGIEKSD